jgi:hypothetical protein
MKWREQLSLPPCRVSESIKTIKTIKPPFAKSSGDEIPDYLALNDGLRHDN